MSTYKRWLPSRESLSANRWVRWIGPSLFDPRLWQARRRSIAVGTSVGLFFGLLIPIAQIPASAAVAVVLRANVPAAVASTLITNPFTFGPIYYAAWWVGSMVLGEGSGPPDAALAGALADGAMTAQVASLAGWWDALVARVSGVGKPLMLGLGLFAVIAGLTAYVAVSMGWRMVIVGRRRRRLRDRSGSGR